MSKWKEYQFSDIAKFEKGVNYTSSDYSTVNNGIPFISIKCLKKGGGFNNRGIKYLKDRFSNNDKLKSNDLLFSITDLTRAGDIVGSPLLIPELYKNSVASMDMMKVYLINNRADIIFIYHLMMLKKVRYYFVNHSSGSTVLHLEVSSIPKIKIKLPPLPHQRKIARILTAVDNVIEKTESAIAKYKAIKQGMMHNLFTRGIDAKTGKLRPTKEEAPHLYKETDLGWIPKVWEVERLEKLGYISYGKDYKANPKGDSVPIWGTGGIMGFTSIYLNKGPAILTGRKGSINNPFYVEGEFWNVDTIFCVKTYDNVNIKWLFHNFENTDLTKLNEATGVPSVNSQALYKLLFSTPPKNEQKVISNKLATLDKKIETEQKQLSKLQKLKQGLMQDLLTGKKEVEPDKEDYDE